MIFPDTSIFNWVQKELMNELQKMDKLCIIEANFKVKLGESIIWSAVHYSGLDFDFISASHAVSLSQTGWHCQLNHQLRVSTPTGHFLRAIQEVLNRPLASWASNKYLP